MALRVDRRSAETKLRRRDSKEEALGYIYETYMTQKNTKLCDLGYQTDPATLSATAEFSILRTTPSEWKSQQTRHHLPSLGFKSGLQESPVSEYVSLDEVLKRGFRERETPARATREMKENTFLESFIFAGLNRLSPTWDSARIAYFDANDFGTVLQRCSESGVQVIGVEVFTVEGRLVKIHIPSCAGDLSHEAFVESLSMEDGLTFSATYRFGVALSGNETQQPPG